MYAMSEFRKPLNSLKKIWTIGLTRYEGRGTRYEGEVIRSTNRYHKMTAIFFIHALLKNKGANLIFFLSILRKCQITENIFQRIFFLLQSNEG